MSSRKSNKFVYAALGCICVGLGLQRIITGEYITESNAVRSGVSVRGTPAVIIGVAVLLLGLYILYLCFFDGDR